MKVFIACSNPEYDFMFESFGWDVISDPEDADLLQFTGGADVSPGLYGEPKHPQSYFNPLRDKREQVLFNMGLKKRLPLAGICRGGQFLNVMCGGRMWQDVDGHAIGGTHTAIDMNTQETFQVTSTHHQMMQASGDGEVIVIANESTFVEAVDPKTNVVKRYGPETLQDDYDTEAIYYPSQRVFCFQPHPEFFGYNELAQRYMKYLENYIL